MTVFCFNGGKMTFTYATELTVHSVIDNLTDAGLPDGDPEINIFTTDGTLKFDGTLTELKYTEKNDEYTTHCTLSIAKDKVFLSRKGAVDCNIIFEEGKRYDCLYRVPPYSFDMSVLTAKIRNSLSDDGGELQLIYSMNIGGQDKKVRMKIRASTKK